VDSAVAEVDPVAAVEAGGNMNSRIFTLVSHATVLVIAASVGFAQSATPPQAAPQKAPQKIAQKTFESPEAATQALLDAVSSNDTATLKGVLGSSAKGILTSGDPKQDEAERQEFARIANQKHQIERSSINSHVRILVIGEQQWPFPIPLVQDGQRWRFDPERGAYEMKAREIGANELNAIEACAAFVGVQQEYATKKRTAAGTVEYAESVGSALPGSDVPKEFAEAAGQNPTRPYHGYFFRELNEQGPHAPGGQHPYKLGKAMIGGFALVAWPATYGVTGIHTFIVSHDGVVYEKDRGTRPATPVATYDPDTTWTPVD